MPTYKTQQELEEERRRQEQPQARQAPAPQQPAQQPAPQKYPGAYDPTQNQAYNNALDALHKAQGQTPVYNNPFDKQVEDAYNNLVNMKPFEFSLNGNAMYDSYKDQFTKLGQGAMRDTMAQAAGLTGGYGSTYSQQAGQQAYNAYLQRLGDVVPELHGAAMRQYGAERDRLGDQYNILSGERDRVYREHQDAVDRHNQELDRLQGQVDSEYGKGYDAWKQQQAADEKADADRKQAYDELVDLILGGYVPDKEELEAAGMSDKRYEYFKNLYQQSITPASSGGGSGRGPRKDDDEKVKKDRVETFNWDMSKFQQNGASDEELYKYLKLAEQDGRLSHEDAKRAEDHYFPHGNPSKKPVRKPTINDQVSFYDKHKLPSLPSASLKKKEEEKKRRRS